MQEVGGAAGEPCGFAAAALAVALGGTGPPPKVVLDLDPASAETLGEGAESACPDANRRALVAVPKSLRDLKLTAALRFDPRGQSCRQRVFCNGKELHGQRAVADLRDGDVVTVRFEVPRALKQAGYTTTNQADFVKHPQFGPAPAGVGAEDGIVKEQHPLSGISQYAADFVQPNLEAKHRQQADTPQVPYSMHFLQQSGRNGAERTPRSVYHTHYPRHPLLPPQAAGDKAAAVSVLTAASRCHPLSARTSYSEDYKKRPNPVGLVPGKRIGGREWKSCLTEQARRAQFDGVTQYAEDFVTQEGGRQPSARPPRVATAKEPFQGDTEYQNQYVDRNFRVPLLDLRAEGLR